MGRGEESAMKKQRYLSGKELLERRRRERESAEKRIRDGKEADRPSIQVYPASLFTDTWIR